MTGDPSRLPAARSPLDARDLRADCSRCAGLCCVVPAFSRSSDFAIDKPAGRPCPNLRRDCRCGIHSELGERGFHGCTVFDCLGAGQKIVQTVFAGRDWHDEADVAAQMFAVFPVMRQLHELLWHVAEALTLEVPAALRAELATAAQRIDALTRQGPVALAAVRPDDEFQRANPLLQRASEHVRAAVRAPGADRRGAQLMGANLRGADLRGTSLRGAQLVGADLRAADLRLADLTGADLRGADLRGADLSTALFLTQAQLDSARGDASTRIPGARVRPARWTRLAVAVRLDPPRRRRR